MITTRMFSDIRDYILKNIRYIRIYINGSWIEYNNIYGISENDNKVVYELPIEIDGTVSKVEVYKEGHVLWDDRNDSFIVERIDGTDALIYKIIYTISID